MSERVAEAGSVWVRKYGEPYEVMVDKQTEERVHYSRVLAGSGVMGATLLSTKRKGNSSIASFFSNYRRKPTPAPSKEWVASGCEKYGNLDEPRLPLTFKNPDTKALSLWLLVESHKIKVLLADILRELKRGSR